MLDFTWTHTFYQVHFLEMQNIDAISKVEWKKVHMGKFQLKIIVSYTYRIDGCQL